MIEVFEQYSKAKVGTFPTREKAEAWIYRRAVEWNFGIYRTYTIGKKTYYDCGPRTFFIINEK